MNESTYPVIRRVEAVWKQPDLPPHLSNISISDEYKADFLSVECGGKNGFLANLGG